MCSGDQQRARRRDECFVDVVFGNRHVGAILAEEDERERVAILDAEHDASGQAPRIGADMRGVASFLLERLDEEASHRIVADARDQRGLQPQPRAAECRVRRRASEILGKARDILEPRADLLRVEVLAEAAEGDDVKGSTLGKAGFVIHRRSGLLASFRRLCRWALVSLGACVVGLLEAKAARSEARFAAHSDYRASGRVGANAGESGHIRFVW